MHSEGTFNAGDGTVVFHQAWRVESPRGAVVIAHGASEHSGRYARFAGALNEAGWDVLALDHRGHGRTRESTGVGRLGPAGAQGLLDDLGRLVTEAGAGGGPVVLFGHSMGSVITQAYAAAGAAGLAGYVLSGPLGVVEGAEELRAGLEEAVAAGMGEEPIDLLAAYNEPFEPARTPFDWLTRDPDEVDAYIADPFCGPANPLTYGFVAGLLALGLPALEPDRIAAMPDIPVLLIAGESDPVGSMAANVRALEPRLREGGLLTTARYYPEARHELLNEVHRDEVAADVIAWLDGVP